MALKLTPSPQTIDEVTVRAFTRSPAYYARVDNDVLPLLEDLRLAQGRSAAGGIGPAYRVPV